MATFIFCFDEPLVVVMVQSFQARTADAGADESSKAAAGIATG
jgi:hypothetical protein